MQVRQIMTPNPQCVQTTATVQQVAELMRNLDVGSIPVVQNNELVGIITDRDIATRSTAAGFDPNTTTAAAIMSRNLIGVYEDQDVTQAASIMRANQIRRLPVLDRSRRVIGIVALGDIAVDSGNEELSGQTLEQVSEPAHPNR